MKRILSLVLVLGLIFTCFAGCSDDKGRILYNVDLDDYIKLGQYKDLKIDTKAEDFLQTYNSIIMSDVEQNGLYQTKKEGTVKDGDNVNIDYTGKKDGVAFEGGTAKGQNLVIGSDSFIDGFEDGLIGKEIGSTVDLNLTFPEEYHNEELSGEDVVFTVKINYITTESPIDPEDYYISLKYDSVDEYYENVRERAIGETLQSMVIEKTEVIDYPKADVDYLYKEYYADYEEFFNQNYQMTVSDYLAAVGQTEENLKNEITTQVKSLMDMQMAWYSILDKEELELTENDKEEVIKEIIAASGDSSVTRADVLESYGDYYIEMVTVSEKVFEFIKKNAKIS